MSSLSNIPKQSYFSAQLQSPIEAAQTTGIILTSVPAYTPSGETVFFNILDAGRVETISATGWDLVTKELSGVVRAVATYTGETATAYSHGSGVTVVLSDDWKYFEAVQTAVNSKFDTTGGTITGATSFSGASTTFRIPNLTTAQKTAIASPANGMLVYDTDTGEFQYYDGGAWLSVGTSAIPNASETVAGIVEEATVAQLNAGTDAGETGARLFFPPSKIATAIQDSKFIYALTTGAADAYVLTPTPAITAYTAGQLFLAKIHATNTTTSTANISGLGVKTIKKNNDRDLEAGDLEAGQIAIWGYDGTNLQLLSLTGTGLTTAQVNTLVGGANSDASTLHSHPLQAILRETLGLNRYIFNQFDTNDRTASVGYTESLVGGASTLVETLVGTNFTTGATIGNSATIATTQLDDGFLPSAPWAKNAMLEFQVKVDQLTAQVVWMGIGDGITIGSTNSTTKHYGFFIENGALYASNADGTTQTKSVDISAGITLTEINTFQIEVNSGTNIKFYVNGNLVATHTTNLPGVNATNFNSQFSISTSASASKTMSVFRRVFFLIKAT